LSLTRSIIDINESDERVKKIYSVYGFEYNPKPIKIFIDSYGGMVYQCFGLLSIMNSSKTPIETVVTGCAMSCGFLIAIHGHKRFAHKNATFMYHQVSSGTSGKVAEMQEDLTETLRLQEKIEAMALERTKIPAKKLKKNYKSKKDWFMNVNEALKYKIIDEVI